MMGYRIGCPKCDAWTSALFNAMSEGLPCPYCGADIYTSENIKHYYDQLPD